MKVTTGFSPNGDRYVFDFRLCPSSKGWAQVDTRQDASYYGNWVNPLTFELVSYAEGDQSHTQCDGADEFAAQVRSMVEWQKGAGHFIGIDGMCNERIIEAMNQLGLSEYLH
jgi:hypothetical protein